MKLKLAISALAACALASGTAMADGPKHKKHNRAASGSVAAGVVAAGPGGAVAGGGSGSAATQPGMTRQTRRSGQNTTTSIACIPNSVATTSNNTAHIGTTTASGASSTSATGQGSGGVSATSDGGVYAARDRNSAEVDAYGTSNAQARPSRRC